MNLKKYWPHIVSGILFAWTYLQPGVLQMVQAAAAKNPQLTFLSIIAALIGMYHLANPTQQSAAPPTPTAAQK